jgi:DNA-binding transcriptional ArsR family regulator
MDYQQILVALADSSRLQILDKLREGPHSVSEIAEVLPIGRSAVSQHLKVMKEASVVVDKARGTRRFYDIDTRGIRHLQEWLDSF